MFMCLRSVGATQFCQLSSQNTASSMPLCEVDSRLIAVFIEFCEWKIFFAAHTTFFKWKGKSLLSVLLWKEKKHPVVL